jgi:transposase-like protein
MVKVLSMKLKLLCPFCQSDSVKEIVYGLPDFSTIDFDRYQVGGCCVAPDDPRYKCLNCELSC